MTLILWSIMETRDGAYLGTAWFRGGVRVDLALGCDPGYARDAMRAWARGWMTA